MDIVFVVFAAIFVAWLVVTIASQVPGSALAARITSADPYGLVPQWSFFAPNPGTSDHFLLYRVRRGGTWQRWTPLVTALRPRALAAMWNPGKRRVKALYDMAQVLSRLMLLEPHLPPRIVCLSTPYVALLTVVVQQARQDPAAGACQFAIATIDARDPDLRAQLVMQSESHRIEPTADVAAAASLR